MSLTCSMDLECSCGAVWQPRSRFITPAKAEMLAREDGWFVNTDLPVPVIACRECFTRAAIKLARRKALLAIPFN